MYSILRYIRLRHRSCKKIEVYILQTPFSIFEMMAPVSATFCIATHRDLSGMWYNQLNNNIVPEKKCHPTVLMSISRRKFERLQSIIGQYNFKLYQIRHN